MISWRYHVLSVVAVLLALGLGLLAGTSVIGDRFAETLQSNYNRAAKDRDEARERVGSLEDFVSQAKPHLVSGALAGQEVVVMTPEGLDPGLSSLVRRELTDAGAEVTATLQLNRELTSPASPEDEAALADAMGLFAVEGEAVPQAAATLLAERLIDGPEQGPEPGVLERLAEDGRFVSVLDLPSGTLDDVGGSRQMVLVVSGGDPKGPSTPDGFLVPMVTALAAGGELVGVGTGSRGSFNLVDAIADADQVDPATIVTATQIDDPMGATALILGLQRLVEVGSGGAYGPDLPDKLPQPVVPAPAP